MSAAESPTELLHRLTSFAVFDEDTVWQPPVDDPRVVQGLTTNDLSRLPWFYKHYDAALPRLDLPRDLPMSTASAIDVLAGRGPEEGRLDLSQLGRLLFLCAGVTRTQERPSVTWLFRASGSAGARFPLEVYVAVPHGHDLPAGVHRYHPEDHALVQIGPPPVADAVTLVLSGIPWRTGWRYRERGFRHIYWDAGTALSQLLAAAASAGVAADVYTRFPDPDVCDLIGADGVHEWPVALVALGSGSPAVAATERAAAGAVDKDPLEFPLVTRAQRAGDMTGLGVPWSTPAPVDVSSADTAPVEDVILRRGSQRLMDPSRRLTNSVVSTSLVVAMRGIEVTHWVVVHGIDGVGPGLYRYPDLADPVRGGELRGETRRLCMEQGLAHDAAFVVVATTTDWDDDRAYREQQLAAGIVEGRLHLAAYALGAAASGMTFVDGLLPAFLGTRMQGLLCTCVGVPEYQSRAGGAPARPVRVRPVNPR